MQFVLISALEIKLIFLEPMLEDPRLFGLTNVEGTQLQSKANSIGTFPKLFGILIMGIL